MKAKNGINKYDICTMCKEDKILTYHIKPRINVCTLCYESIPNHIPLSQDSQYVTEFVRKKK